jgi:hypothetical protein
MATINKATSQSLADMINVIGQAQTSGKGLSVNKDGSIQVASLGTRALRVIGEKIKGSAWAEAQNLKINAQVAEKFNAAVLQKSANYVHHENYGKFKSLLDRAATTKDLPSS